MRLKTDLEKLIAALATLYEPVGSAEFANHLLAVVEKVFPEAVLIFDRFDLRTGIAEDASQ
jgi:hypothetical protein